MLLQFVYNQRVSFFELIKNLSHTEKSLHVAALCKQHSPAITQAMRY
jgi:hypothetical protein